MIPVIPLVLCTPKYLDGKLSLGEVMQLASAFIQVQLAIAWIVDHFRAIAEWFASAKRITELVNELSASSDADKTGFTNKIMRFEKNSDCIEIKSLSLIDEKTPFS
jgi:putative ATP-binding cassette transporter